MGQTLLIAQFDAREVQHAVLHRGGDACPLRHGPLVKRVTMPSARCRPVPCRRSGHRDERPVRRETPVVDAEPPVHCATFSYTFNLHRDRPKSLDRCHDHFRVDAVDLFPGKIPSGRARRGRNSPPARRILDQRGEDFLALRFLVSSVSSACCG